MRAADGPDINNLHCNVVSNVIQVDVDSIPNLSFGSNSPVCEDSDVVFNLAGAANYLGSGPNGYSDNTGKPHVYHPSLAGSGRHHVLATSFGGRPRTGSAPAPVQGRDVPGRRG